MYFQVFFFIFTNLILIHFVFTEMDPYAKWKRKKAVKPRKKDLEEEELRKCV